jgi:hypothetical protein
MVADAGDPDGAHAYDAVRTAPLVIVPPALIPRFRDQFGVPGSYLPIGAVAIGHPDPANDQGGSSRVIRRRSLDELVHHGHW